MPTRGTLQDLVAIGRKVTMPCLLGLIVLVILPLEFDGLVVTLIPGPLFFTTIVHVMSLNAGSVAGEPDFVICRSVMPCTQVEASDSSEPSFAVVTLPVLSTTPVSGQIPPVASVVAEMMCTVKVLAA